MDSINGSTSVHRSGRPSTPTNGNNIMNRRNADRERELQQLKSRGVVSVLNKTFDSHGNYVLAPASPPNPSVPPSSANSLSNRSWRKSTSGTTDLHAEGAVRISTNQQLQQQSMLCDEALTTSPSDITSTPSISLRKARSQDHSTATNEQDILEISDKADTDIALFHIKNHSCLINQYKAILQQHRQTEDKLLSCQLERQQMETTARQMVEKSLIQSVEEAGKVRQLSTMALKQDRVIHELESALSLVLDDNNRLQQQLTKNNNSSNKGDRLDSDSGDMDSNWPTQDEMVNMRQELEDLRNNRIGYKNQIVSLCSALESSQRETDRLTAMMDNINQQCHQHQLQIDEKLGKMEQQLARKDDLIRKYQQESRYYSQMVDRSSMVRGTISMENLRSRSRGSIPPPVGPPPSTPLPALPVTGPPAQSNPEYNRSTEQQQREQLSPQSLPSDYEQDQHVLTPSMEILLLQAPSTYCLDESALMMDKAHREYTEQLQNRLSISKEIDHLELWDHAALERLQLQQQQMKRTSLAPTTTTASSSKWSDRSSSAFESDWDDKQGNSTFWKGMKKKLRV